MLTIIGKTFPSDWQYGPEEIAILKSTAKQIDDHFPEQNNLLINTTWFGPQFAADDNTGWIQVETLINQNKSFDNLFLLSTVDPAMINPDQIEKIVALLGDPELFKIGNFDPPEV